MMSRCRKKMATNMLPAFNLDIVRQYTDVIMDVENEQVCNAAACHPITDINNRVFIGTWRDAADEQLLRRHRITHVLNVARELIPEEELCRMKSIQFVKSKCIPLSDSQNEDLERYFDEAFEFIRSAVHQGRILVHCRRGISRSAAIVIAYIMASEGQSFRTAFENVRMKRPCISLNLAFIQRLEEFEAHLHLMRPTYGIEYDGKDDLHAECVDVMHVNEGVLSEPQSTLLEMRCGFEK
ncbi:putative dual specificity protein phosphatase or MAP kinase phosphatase [Trypanosoma cruzi]|uniref:protein-tyrosine-phosphatase n=2 Tax=Trypanosoma cruzi TaxID=5693 RepID=Q4D680_TRYCC|nr:dual specificity protein phosphatase or MAP kinase phosphatase, putative [Trypanosoma cruzi]EAN88030.1 dual specificity protein phosphatase or MAP kinase phosphatase, putative [Trypanosoma cruzi]PWV17308.1 putative dual specificity protein phosphatase or MAP kinase phosphatase [Trypanosoma cruzi]|eukprot:XP_809881.1 dual specificity protein phosphatase or MAP kinase phosphatase [Trypanosoma cruzi strain CL Brener]